MVDDNMHLHEAVISSLNQRRFRNKGCKTGMEKKVSSVGEEVNSKGVLISFEKMQ